MMKLPLPLVLRLLCAAGLLRAQRPREGKWNAVLRPALERMTPA